MLLICTNAWHAYNTHLTSARRCVCAYLCSGMCVFTQRMSYKCVWLCTTSSGLTPSPIWVLCRNVRFTRYIRRTYFLRLILNVYIYFCEKVLYLLCWYTYIIFLWFLELIFFLLFRNAQWVFLPKIERFFFNLLVPSTFELSILTFQEFISI